MRRNRFSGSQVSEMCFYLFKVVGILFQLVNLKLYIWASLKSKVSYNLGPIKTYSTRFSKLLIVRICGDS